MSITAENLSWAIGAKPILTGVSLTVPPGQTLGLLGPNGSGKTSLLRLLAGLKRPDAGRVLLDGADIGQINRRTLARRIAFVEQHAATTADLRVVDVVKLGRFPHRPIFAGWTTADETAVQQAMARAGIAPKSTARWQTLSGGEKQRTHIARALAQNPSELLLDEPTNHLDIQHQIGLLRLITSLSLTSVIALHDLNHAAMFCDRLIVLQAGRIVASGDPTAVLTEPLLKDIFAVEARVETSPHHGRPHIHYLR